MLEVHIFLLQLFYMLNMDNQTNHSNIFFLILSIFFGGVSLMQTKPIFDFIFIILAIAGALTTLIINIRKIKNKEY